VRKLSKVYISENTYIDLMESKDKDIEWLNNQNISINKRNKEIAINKFIHYGLSQEEGEYLAQDVAELSVYYDGEIFIDAEDSVKCIEEAYDDKYYMSTVDSIIEQRLPIKDIAYTGIQAKKKGLNFEERTNLKNIILSKLEDNNIDISNFKEYFLDTLNVVHSENKNIKIEKEYYESGVLKLETPFTEGIRHGQTRGYYENGNLEYEIFFVKGVKNGVEKGYYKSGRIHHEMPYVDDKVDGIEVGYYEDGTIQYEMSCVNGKQNGVEKSYYENGTIEYEVSYVNDEKDGIEKAYNEDGSLTHEKRFSVGLECRIKHTQRYFFENYGLKELVFSSENLSILEDLNTNHIVAIKNIWDMVTNLYIEHIDDDYIFNMNDFDIQIDELDNRYIVVIQMPKPTITPECYYIGLIIPKKGIEMDTRYLTLEYSYNDKLEASCFCEWSDTEESHLNYGIEINTSKENFYEKLLNF